MTGSVPPPNRRLHPRFHAHFPANVAYNGGNDHLALVADISVAGALILVRSPPPPGARAMLTLHMFHDDQERTQTILAGVVRVDPLRSDARDVWQYVVALKFDRLHPGIEDDIE